MKILCLILALAISAPIYKTQNPSTKIHTKHKHMTQTELIEHYERLGEKIISKRIDNSGVTLALTTASHLTRRDHQLLSSLGEDTNLPPRMKWLKAATQEVDRMGDVMVIAGAELDNFRRNPQFLWQHGMTSEPIHTIGRILRIVQTNNTLYALAEYTPDGSSELADRVYTLDRDGYLPANSIGFRPIEWKPNNHGGVTFTKWELLEISKVELPANQEAVDE